MRQAGRRPAGLSARETATFATAVALLAIFWDAAVGHGLTWENDPYWTYWVTKTFLIFTVFGLGTAWLGIGLGVGAVLTAVHTLVLTVYYWTLSPIGLPSSPEWLDLEHTWVTGLPIHFAVIYLGYLAALWLWRRRGLHAEPAPLAALAVAVTIVVVAGGAGALVLWDWPGVTFFVVRLLITVPFVLLWSALAGRDAIAAVTGAVTLAFVWATYGEYLGPVGLPDTPLRILGQEPPPATAGWLDYRETWLISLPVYLVAMGVVFLLVSRVRRQLVPLGAVAVLAAPLLLANVWIGSGGQEARLQASGSAQVETGEWFSDELARAEATLALEAEDRIRKVTPLPPHDELLIESRVSHPNGGAYEIAVDQAMVSDPAGRHTTWWGVGIDVWHHGRSGIGTDRIPAVRSEVAVFGLGRVSLDGEAVAAGVPVHVMTTGTRLELDVGDPATPVPGLPDGHLRVVWDAYEGGADRDGEWVRYAVGDLVLLLLLVFALRANWQSA